MLFNYVVGSQLSRDEEGRKHYSKKNTLIIGIIANVALLGYFKYSDFFISNLNYIIDGNLSLLNLALPLAISFYTFQQIAYLVDSYRGETKEYDFLNYAVFVTFFPQLIAGPIVHHSEMMPQFKQVRNQIINYRNIALGLFIFSMGLFKKVVIADAFAVWATNGFDVAEHLNLIEAWVTSLSYTFQLYFDFSGYTDMAIGIALLFNIRLPINFNSPYKATSIQDFWRRWHITLSRFLRDYIYIPLGGNRNGDISMYSNLLITFLIGGIWHGAGWTFLFWGLLHGSALVIQRVWHNTGIVLHTLLAWFITFNFINITWVFFRAKEWDDAIKVLSGMFSYNIILPDSMRSKLSFLSQYGIDFGNWLSGVKGDIYTPVWMLFAFILVLLFKNSTERININSSKPAYVMSVYTALLTVLAIMSMIQTPYTEFLYFNF